MPRIPRVVRKMGPDFSAMFNNGHFSGAKPLDKKAAPECGASTPRPQPC